MSASFPLLEYESLDSTNEEARRLLAANRPREPFAVVAAAQTSGKGTRGRTWASPLDAGLYLSIVHPDFRPGDSADPPQISLLTMTAGVACADALREITGLSIRLKPINDLYVGNRKLGGILTESLFQGNACKALITGIGVNLREDPAVDQACREDRRGNQPISLEACIAPEIFKRWHIHALRRELALALALAVDGRYRELAAGGGDDLLRAYQALTLPQLTEKHLIHP